MIKRTIIRYFIVGGLCFIIDFAVFIFLIEFLFIAWQLSLSISFITATYLNYYLSRNFVFAKIYQRNPETQLILTFVVSFFTLLINYSIVYFVHEVLILNIYIGKFFSIFCGFLINYYVRKKAIFI